MAEKSVYIQRLDEIENQVYQRFLKPLGFRKHGRSLNRVVDGDMVQIVYFEGGNVIRQEDDSFRVHFSIRVPEAVERTFTPKPLKKGGYHEADANFRMHEMCKLEQLGAIPSYYRYPLFEGCEEQYIERIIKVLKEQILPVFDDMNTREAFLLNREKYASMAWLEHLRLLDQAMILGRLGRMEEAQESFQRFYEDGVEKDRKLIEAGKMTDKSMRIRKQVMEDLAESLGIELRRIQMPTRLETTRLILRPFIEADAPDLYASASDRRVGHSAGWEPHKSVEESLEIIRTVFSAPNTFAVVDKETGHVIGSAGFNDGHQTLLPGPDDEIGYALHPDYWGRGLMPEVVRELLRYGFEELGLNAIWCGHFADNTNSRRVIEKCGFIYRFTDRVWVEVLGKEQDELHYALTKEEWQAL